MSEQQKQSEAAVDNASAVQSTVDDLGGCKKLVRVEVPVGVVDAMFDGITRQFMKFAQLPGFRPGKAPKHLVIKSYEGRIQEETKKKLLEDSFRAAVDQNKLRVVVTLNVEDESDEKQGRNCLDSSF